jgi:tetratricopeptide (TPR) repeat protein
MLLTAIPALVLAFLPLKEDMPLMVNIPSAITQFYPLPEEQMMRSYARGQEYLLLGRFEESLLELDRAVELAPESPDVYISRGITEEKLLKWEDAIKDYNTANELLRTRSLFKKDDPVCLSNKANAELGAERWTQALKDFEAAANLRPNYEAPVIGKGLALYQLGREADSFKVLKDLSDKYPSFADAKAALAVMSYKTGNTQQALELFEDALEGDARYVDLEWVREIRRWTPRLTDDLGALLSDKLFSDIIANSKTIAVDEDY